MSEWFLQAKISNPDLLFEIIHALGQTFYRKLNGEYEVVYFSGSKAVYFKGKLSKQEAEKLRNLGFEVSKLEVDEEGKVVRIEE